MSGVPEGPVLFDGSPLSLEQVGAVAAGAGVELGPAAFRDRIDAGAGWVDRLLAEGRKIYGVNTGYGDSVGVSVAPDGVGDLPGRLVEYHGCGLGEPFSPQETRAILAARLASLARGYSGVSSGLLEALAGLLNRGVLPVIPQEGSVGASGDLTPLSYVAAVLGGGRMVHSGGSPRPAREVLAEKGLKPYRLRPKEGLALMNGTAAMTGLACLNHLRASRLAALASRATALAALALGDGSAHFGAGLFQAKPFPGQGRVAARLRRDIEGCGLKASSGEPLQERYSVRCAPHVLGVLEDSLPWQRSFLETELNSSNDNPLIDPDGGEVWHGGHFYGGHVCAVSDSLKASCASVADLLDRQIALLVDPRYSRGLPPNLSGARQGVHHGLKALQITASACTAEALKLTLPASAFSRSTESHNQDKVSLGTLAARDARRVLELAEQVLACALLASAQALELRLALSGTGPGTLRGGVAETLAFVRARSPFLEGDRALEGDLRALIADLRGGAHLPYPEGA